MFKQIHILAFAAFFASAVVATPPASGQTTWSVDDDAPNDPGPGDPAVSDPLEDGSAAHPFDAIQEGIDAASGGDTVLVLDGTYTGLGNKNLDFHAKAIAVRSENGPQECIVDCQDSGRAFYFVTEERSTSVVDGFTVIRGYAPDGGAVYCANSSPEISNCTMSANTAFTYSGSPHGGAVYCVNSSPTISNCSMTDNMALSWPYYLSYGGAVYCANSSPAISNCSFSANMAQYGGAVACDASSPRIISCVVSANRANGSGGGAYCSSSSPTITDCTFSDNEAWPSHGGAIYCVGYSSPSPRISDCTMTGNLSLGRGGAIFCYNDSNPEISNCTISDNRAANWQGGGVCCFSASPTISNCIISDNWTSYYGGGVACFYSSVAISNCTITANTAGHNGGGVSCVNSTPAMGNCILWADMPDEFLAGADSEPIVRYSDVLGGWAARATLTLIPASSILMVPTTIRTPGKTTTTALAPAHPASTPGAIAASCRISPTSTTTATPANPRRWTWTAKAAFSTTRTRRTPAAAARRSSTWGLMNTAAPEHSRASAISTVIATLI
jgi:hypothetical protein